MLCNFPVVPKFDMETKSRPDLHKNINLLENYHRTIFAKSTSVAFIAFCRDVNQLLLHFCFYICWHGNQTKEAKESNRIILVEGQLKNTHIFFNDIRSIVLEMPVTISYFNPCHAE